MLTVRVLLGSNGVQVPANDGEQHQDRAHNQKGGDPKRPNDLSEHGFILQRLVETQGSSDSISNTVGHWIESFGCDRRTKLALKYQSVLTRSAGSHMRFDSGGLARS